MLILRVNMEYISVGLYDYEEVVSCTAKMTLNRTRVIFPIPHSLFHKML